MSHSPEIAKLAEFLQKEKQKFEIPVSVDPPKTEKLERFKSIYDIDNLFRTWSNYIQRESFFNRYPEMTNHGIEHIENVVSIIAQIALPFSDIPQERQQGPNAQVPLLNRSEIFCLAAAGWLHDIGMYVTENDPESDDPDLVRDVHGRLSMTKIILERDTLFPGCSEADVRLIGSILAYHQSKAPFDMKAKNEVIEKRLKDGKPPITNLWAQTEVISEIVPARILMKAPMWKDISGGLELNYETLMKIDENGEVSTSVPRIRKPNDKYEERPVVTKEKAGNKWEEWQAWLKSNSGRLWGLQFAPEGERVDPHYLAALLAIADQADVQVARSGNMEFMVRQLDRGNSRFESITYDISKVRGSKKWMDKDNSKKSRDREEEKEIAIKGEDDLEIFEMLEVIKALEMAITIKPDSQDRLSDVLKMLDNIKKWTKEKRKESEYLANGFDHFMPNLVISRALVVQAQTRKRSAGNANPNFMPLELASFEKGRKLPVPHENPVMHVVLVPNDFSRLIGELNMIAERGGFKDLINKIEKALKSTELNLIGCAGSYIAGELNRVQHVLDKRPVINGQPLSFAVYKYDREIDSRALPEDRDRYRGDLPRPAVGRQDGFALVERAFLGELFPKVAFDREDSPRTVIAYGPPGSGRKTAMYQLAMKLTGYDKKRIFWYELERDRKRDRNEDQVTDLIRKLAYFLSCNGEFALDNLLRDAQFITEYHKEFALECLRRSNNAYVICLTDFNCVTMRNRDFFRRLAKRETSPSGEKFQETRVLAVSTRFPEDNWVTTCEKDVKMLRFSAITPEERLAENSNYTGFTEYPDEWHAGITRGEIEAVWSQMERWLAPDSAPDPKTPGVETSRRNQSEKLKDLWKRFGYYLIFVDFMSDIVDQCNFDTIWLEKRMKSAMMGHIESVTSLLGDNEPQKEMASYISHLVSNVDFKASMGDALDSHIKNPFEQLLALEARAIVDIVPKPERNAPQKYLSKNPDKNDFIFMHPAWVRRYSHGDKSIFVGRWRKPAVHKAPTFIEADEFKKLGFEGRQLGKLITAFANAKEKSVLTDREKALRIAAEFRQFVMRNPVDDKNIEKALEEFIEKAIK